MQTKRALLLLLLAAAAVATLVFTGALSSNGEPTATVAPETSATIPTEARRSGDLVPASAPAPADEPQETQGDASSGSDTTASETPRREVDPGPVLLFEHATHDASFPGRTWTLREGLANAGILFGNDETSAVEVPVGLQVTLFEHENGEGQRTVLGPGRHNLAPYGFNDSVSSVRVTRFGEDAGSPVGPRDSVELYEHGKASPASDPGRTWTLTLREGRSQELFTSTRRQFDAGTVSAAWVPHGYELTLFEQPDGRGAALVLGPGLHELEPMRFNDRAASASMRRLRGR